MLIPTPALTASVPYLRMAAGAVVAASAWCVGQYATARVIRKIDKEAFGDSKAPRPPSQHERLHHLQVMVMTTAAAGRPMAEAMQDPDAIAAIRALDRMKAKAVESPSPEVPLAA